MSMLWIVPLFVIPGHFAAWGNMPLLYKEEMYAFLLEKGKRVTMEAEVGKGNLCPQHRPALKKSVFRKTQF